MRLCAQLATIRNRFCMVHLLENFLYFSYHTKMFSYDSKQANLFPLHIRTAYADLLDRLQDLQASHAIASLTSWSLFVKQVKANKYVYAQGRDGRRR